MTTIYTNAPAAYDYGYAVRTTTDRTAYGKPVDAVEVPDEFLRWQEGRYLSGNYLVVLEPNVLS